ncbi:MAG: HEAT repeat domain-containing protein [Planctomycetota bacterium]
MSCASPVVPLPAQPQPQTVWSNEIPPAAWDEDLLLHLSRFEFGLGDVVTEYAATVEGQVEGTVTVEKLAALAACTLDPEVKGRALYLLGASRNAKALVAIGEALSHPDPEVNWWAAWSIDNFWMESPLTAASDAGILMAAGRWWSERALKIRASASAGDARRTPSRVQAGGSVAPLAGTR